MVPSVDAMPHIDQVDGSPIFSIAAASTSEVAR